MGMHALMKSLSFTRLRHQSEVKISNEEGVKQCPVCLHPLGNHMLWVPVTGRDMYSCIDVCCFKARQEDNSCHCEYMYDCLSEES